MYPPPVPPLTSRPPPPPPHPPDPSYLHPAAGLLVVEQQLHGSHHLLADGVQQGVAHVHVEAQQQLYDLQVLVLDGNQQGRAPQGVDAVDVDLEVDLRLLGENKPEDSGGCLVAASPSTHCRVVLPPPCTPPAATPPMWASVCFSIASSHLSSWIARPAGASLRVQQFHLILFQPSPP